MKKSTPFATALRAVRLKEAKKRPTIAMLHARRVVVNSPGGPLLELSLLDMLRHMNFMGELEFRIEIDDKHTVRCSSDATTVHMPSHRPAMMRRQRALARTTMNAGLRSAMVRSRWPRCDMRHHIRNLAIRLSIVAIAVLMAGCTDHDADGSLAQPATGGTPVITVTRIPPMADPITVTVPASYDADTLVLADQYGAWRPVWTLGVGVADYGGTDYWRYLRPLPGYESTATVTITYAPPPQAVAQ